MSGRKAKALRRAFGGKTAQYKRAKQQHRDWPTLFAQGINPVGGRKA